MKEVIQRLKREKRTVAGMYAQYDKGFNHALGIAIDLITNKKSLFIGKKLKNRSE